MEKWVEEISINTERSRKAELLPSEVSDLRAALGTASWRATQVDQEDEEECPARTEVPSLGTAPYTPSGDHLGRCKQSQQTRPDRASTIGTLTGIGPANLLRGEEHDIALLQWKSGKTPRQCLGSNGAEVQSITIGEDQNYEIRGLVFEMTGEELQRDDIHEQVATIAGGLVMDSRGIYDAATRDLSALHDGLAQLADGLTKAENRKTFLSFFTKNQYWRLIHDESFTAGRKLHKKELKAQQESFVTWVKSQAEAFHWPWDEGPLLHYDAFS